MLNWRPCTLTSNGCLTIQTVPSTLYEVRVYRQCVRYDTLWQDVHKTQRASQVANKPTADRTDIRLMTMKRKHYTNVLRYRQVWRQLWRISCLGFMSPGHFDLLTFWPQNWSAMWQRQPSRQFQIVFVLVLEGQMHGTGGWPQTFGEIFVLKETGFRPNWPIPQVVQMERKGPASGKNPWPHNQGLCRWIVLGTPHPDRPR